jgi:CRP-like cAMP-binding protein
VEFGHENQQGNIEEVIRVLGQGNHFGEIALINNVKRTLSVRVTSERAKLLLLTRDTFTRILGSIKSFLKEDWKKTELDDSFASTGSSKKGEKVNVQLFNIKEEEDE